MLELIINLLGGITKEQHDEQLNDVRDRLLKTHAEDTKEIRRLEDELEEAKALLLEKSTTIVALKEEVEAKQEANVPSSFKVGNKNNKAIQLFKSIRGAKEENVVKFYFGKVVRYARLDGDKNDHGLFYKEGKGAEYKHLTFKK